MHDPEYLEAVRRAPSDPWVGHGLGTPDNPIFEGMYDASALIAGGSVLAAQQVHSGKSQHAVNISGGLHHAMRNSASGFCVFNDASIAIAWLLAQGYERIAYVDVDVHHGDGVQAAFYDDPRVLTVSVHQTPLTLFPGTGFPEETGDPQKALGSAVNLALPNGTDDSGWLRAFTAVVPSVLKAFAPQILVTQNGCDAHHEDPLADLALTVDGQRASYPSCTNWPTSCARAGGSPSAAGATGSCAACRGPGPTCSPRSAATGWTRPPRSRSRGGTTSSRAGCAPGRPPT